MVRISIFDYGAGNIFSLESSLKRNGAKVSVIKDLNKITEDFDGLVLPGVGNFDPALISINKCKRRFLNYIEKNIPVLGICLGMEMLFEKSEEGNLEGLKVIEGKVLSLPKTMIKIPHIGWNNLNIINEKSKLFKGIPNGSWVYFVHSYYTVPDDTNIITSRSDYGVSIPSSIEKDNIFCTQFHPEKSSTIGEKMIKNFIKICEGSK
ncbi:MAG TPA: imidazole glycerol phosphate synthase subunit HisH [Candidatus Nitrosocosmicus sp.]|nr:imidazole glycerol phosphate synthase subunit HisH [Candidatus Nitrosocosmicus sp.]